MSGSIARQRISPDTNNSFLDAIAIDEVLPVDVNLALNTYFYEGSKTITFRKGVKRNPPQVFGVWTNPGNGSGNQAFVPYINFLVNGTSLEATADNIVDVSASKESVTVTVRTAYLIETAHLILYVVKDKGGRRQL